MPCYWTHPLFIESRTDDVMKLRMTWFECSSSFRRAWPAIEKRSLSRYFIKIDEFPDPINAAIFSTTKIQRLFERNKEK